MEGNATTFFSTVNLVKTIVGAGMLAIPFAFRNFGVLVGVILTLFASVTSGFGLFVLAKCSKTLKDPRSSSFFTLCSITYPSLSLLFDFSMFIQCYGTNLSYLILVGDLFPGIVGGTREGWILGSSVVILPLVLVKKLDSLKYSSILGLFAIAYMVGLVAGSFMENVLLTDGYKTIRGEVSWIRVYDLKGLISTFSIVIFAYTGSMNIFSIVNELRDNSMKNINKVIITTMSTSSVLFLIVGLCGYLTFGSNVVGNIMLNYDQDSTFTKVGQLCLGVMVTLSFPLLFHPSRVAANNMIYWIMLNFGKCEDHNAPHHEHTHTATPISMNIEEEEDRLVLGNDNGYYSTTSHDADEELQQTRSLQAAGAVPFPDFRFYLITTIMIFSLYLLALNVKSFALVLGVVGATGSTAISFTLPGLFGYKLIGSEAARNGKLMSKSDQFFKFFSLLLTIYGIIVMCLSLYVTLKFGP
ncbi:LADA_0E11210g1_1 [Lachancea dasiensis]|uniref:LADA_0E11210g1_1 n=1 Tax=Lachancea dasiensis TaxID=1072105 RepID=A0A1G4JEM4_9SACH|nr:LADA_0E11210g1_1 [Lachancea dasiensis]